MGFDRRTAVVTAVTTDSATANITSMNLRSQYIRPLNFKATASGTSDTTLRLKLTDADSRIFYLDAADVNYSTATYTPLLSDDLEVGISMSSYDSVGVASAAVQAGPMPVVKSPIEVNILQATAGAILTFELDYEYGVFSKVTAICSAADAAGTSTVTRDLGCKYAQLVGLKASLTSGDTTSLIITDTDGKVIYKDAADKDYSPSLDKGVLLIDDTVTNMTQVVPRDWNGTAIQASTVGHINPPLVRSPLTVATTGQDVLASVMTVDLYIKTA